MNFTMVKFVESEATDTVVHGTEELNVNLLKLVDSAKRPEPVPLCVIPNASHSGKDKGIMRSVISDKSKKPQLAEILKCLQVDSAAKYKAREQELSTLTQQTQRNSKRYTNLVFVLKDDQAEPITDYDIVLLGGPEREPNKLTKGFFVDRQKKRSQSQPLDLLHKLRCYKQEPTHGL